MSFDDTRKELEAVIKVEGPAGVTVGFNAQKFTATNRSVRMVIVNGEAVQKSFGSPNSNLVRYAGVVMFTIFVDGGDGGKVANRYAEVIKDIYQNRRLATVHCGIPYMENTAQDGNLYSVNVIVPFHRDAYEA